MTGPAVPSGTFEGRFFDGQLELVFHAGTPGPGYAVHVAEGRVYRNGDYVADVKSLRYDLNCRGWWVDYRSWRGSPLDHPKVVGEGRA